MKAKRFHPGYACYMLHKEIKEAWYYYSVHFHMLFPDGVYVDSGARFLPVCCPLLTEMADLVCRISLRIVRYLERAGLIEKDAENCYPTENMGDENELVIITVCEACGGAVKIIASIEDPAVIRQILSHLQTDGSVLDEALLPPNRAPPAA